MQALYDTMFQMGVLCFFLGVILPFITWSNQRLSNLLASGAALFGGILTATAAWLILMSKNALHVYAWHVTEQIRLHFYFDTLAAFFLLIVGVMSAAGSFYMYGWTRRYYEEKRAAWLGAQINLFLLSLIGVVGAANAAAFLLFWEFMAFASFLLVMFDHVSNKVRAGGYLYIALTHIGSVFLTVAFLLLFCYTGSLEFADYKKFAPQLPEWIKNTVFLLCVGGFGAKMGLFPLHVWLPRAYPVTPSSAAVFMSSAMIKTAVYAFLRLTFDLLGAGPAWWGALAMGIGVATAVFCILLAAIQNDMKRFLAYSSAENLGVIFVGIGAALFFQSSQQPAAAALALTAALYHVLNHAIFKGLLFMGAGAVEAAAQTTNINALGGLIRRMPQTAVFILVGFMSLAALPPLGGFISEWAVLQSLFFLIFTSPGAWVKLAGTLVLALVGLSSAFCAVAVVKQFGIAFLAKARSKKAEKATEACCSMRCSMAVLAFLSLGLGLFPGGALLLTNAVVGMYFPILPAKVSGLFILPHELGNGQMLSAGALLIIGALLFGSVVAVLRFFCGPSKVVYEETWNCGTAHRPQMEYTGTGYSHPVLLIYKWLMGLTRNVQVEQEYVYYPKKIGHQLSISARIADNVYRPCVDFMVRLFKRIRMIQSGNLQAYLSYMIAALIITLLWIG